MSAKKRKWLVRLAVGFLVLVVAGWLMGQIDYALLVEGKRPVFARVSLSLSDGGTILYLGLGYTVTQLHEMGDYIGLPDYPTTNALYTGMAFHTGPKLDYWTPFVSREQTIVVFETNQPEPIRYPRTINTVVETNK